MKRNKFSLSHYRLFSGKMGALMPASLLEVLPGDTIQWSSHALVRAAPLLAPVMHPCQVRIHHWFVPFRLIWSSWQDFITGGPDGLDASVFPTMTAGTGTVGELADYLGVQTGAFTVPVSSALPFRAYSLIWNEFYRDQDLETKLVVSTASGTDTTTNTTLQNCDWEKDYFTSARPWPQKGASVSIPVGGTGSVVSTGASGSQVVNMAASGATSQVALAAGNTIAGNPLQISGSAYNVSISGLRTALAIERFEEARARYGSRYTEYLRYLGVRSSDARLQRPEYLGGGKQTIQFSEVLQTAEGTNPVGQLRGHGISAMRSNRFRRFIEEHGYIMTLFSIRPKTMYITGLPRTWNRRVKEDFWQKELEHIGQDIIKNKELDASHATPDGTFGYQDMYDSYRRQESGVAGAFRSSTLNFWHMARDFTPNPALNATFVKCVPTNRIYANTSADQVYVMINHSVQARRMVARSGGESWAR